MTGGECSSICGHCTPALLYSRRQNQAPHLLSVVEPMCGSLRWCRVLHIRLITSTGLEASTQHHICCSGQQRFQEAGRASEFLRGKVWLSIEYDTVSNRAAAQTDRGCPRKLGQNSLLWLLKVSQEA